MPAPGAVALELVLQKPTVGRGHLESLRGDLPGFVEAHAAGGLGIRLAQEDQVAIFVQLELMVVGLKELYVHYEVLNTISTGIGGDGGGQQEGDNIKKGTIFLPYCSTSCRPWWPAHRP